MKNRKYGLNWICRKTKGLRLPLLIYAFLVLCVPVLQLAFAYCMKLFIDAATGSIADPLYMIGIYTTAVVGIGGIVMMIQAVLSKWISGKMECNLRAELMAVILSRRMIDISKQHTGELLTKLTSDTQAVSLCLPAMIENLAGGLFSALLATAALFFLNWKIALILLVFIPILMFVMGIFGPRIQEVSALDKGNDEKNRSLMQENLSRIMLIKTYLMQRQTVQKTKHTYQQKLKSGIRLGMWEGISAFAGALSGNVMSMITLGLGSYFVLRGETTVGSLIMIVQLLNYIVTPVSRLPVAAAQVGQAITSSGRIGTIYELPEEKEITAAAPVNVMELVASDLCFSYDSEKEEGGQTHLLDNVNLLFSKGEITGIVGKSGSGKSTLLKLMIGLYTPQRGTVELKHQSGSLLGEQIMTQVAYVPSDDHLFSGTVSDNIVMSEQEPRYDHMQAAATGANIDDFIKMLPKGFDTILGENGGTVSSGQAQRIAIARAIYKNAGIIVFDEPTANLDVDSIEKFQMAARKLSNDHICIMVTHDVSTITICDKVYELEHGSVRQLPPCHVPLSF